jgi:hypothetical protein
MYIRNQVWIKQGGNYYLTRLHECYWSAWQRFGWEKGIAGIGIACEVVSRAINDNCGVVIHVAKYGVFRASSEVLQKYREQKYLFTAHDHKFLYVYPQNEFEVIKPSTEDKINDNIKEEKRVINQQLIFNQI